MLLDARHKPWALLFAVGSIVALAAYALADWFTPQGLTGGSRIGLAFGILGFLIILFELALSGLRYVPSWWFIGSRQSWLRAHIWLGLLCGVVVLCHSSFRFGGLFEQILMAVFGLVLLSGVLGVALQQVLPRLMTQRITTEVPYEQIPHLCAGLKRRADEVAGTLERNAHLPEGTREQLSRFHAEVLAPFLLGEHPSQSPLRQPARSEEMFGRLRSLPGAEHVNEELGRLELLCSERRAMAEQARLHVWLHSWLYLHVPLSWVLLVLSVVHASMALYY